MKHLDRKTDLHGFLYPFTLLAIERKTLFAVSKDDPSLSRALYANMNVIEARTVSGIGIIERNDDVFRKRSLRVKKVRENGRGI